MRRTIHLLVGTFTLISILLSAVMPSRVVSAAPLFAITISPTKTDAIVSDDGDGKADPGEKIKYTIVIPNSGSTDATGVTFQDVIDSNTTFVAGSINVSPIAINDSYETIGNTLLEVGVTASGNPAVTVSGNLFSNDIEFLSDTASLDSVQSNTFVSTSVTSTTDQAGTVTVFANGTFSYIPAANYTGDDTFTYTVIDSGGLSDTATVTITVKSRVWYVKNNAAANGTGRSSDPFDTLAEAQTASSAGDTIYVFYGDGTTTGQAAGIVLKDQQRLLGEGVALTMPVSVNGGANPTTLRAAGSKPLIDNTAGDCVSVSTASIGATFSNIEVRGLNIAANTNGLDVTTANTFGGSFEFADNIIRSSSLEGVDINGAGTGTLIVSIHDNTITSNGYGIDISRTAGSVVVKSFDDNVISGDTTTTGIRVVGTGATVLFDADPATAVFDTVSGGTTLIGQSGNGVGASGMLLNNIRGDLNFTDLDIYADNGTALYVNGTSPNYTGTTGTRFRVTNNAPFFYTFNGPAVDLTDVNVNLVFNSLSSANSTTTGVSLTRVSGTFTAPTSAQIANATGVDFSINGGSNASANVAVTYNGTISDTSGTGGIVQIQNVTAASTHIFAGAISGTSGTNTGISLTGNTGATITFSGGLSLSTGANPAFTATGGGTVNVCDENPCDSSATGANANTLTTTTGTALNVANTNIGSNNLEFRNISAGTVAGGPANGIILNTTGSSGGLKVKGTGSANSGGTIQKTTGSGVSLTSTQNVSFDRMNIQSTGGSGIDGTSVTNFSFTNGTINVSGDAAGESNIAFKSSTNNINGTLTVTGSTLTNAFDSGIDVSNSNGTISDAVITGNTITSSTSTASSLGDGISLVGTGTISTVSNLTKATISSNAISNFPSGSGVFVVYGNSTSGGPAGQAGTLNSVTNIVTISSNTIQGNSSANVMGLYGVLFVIRGATLGSRSQGNVSISNNSSIQNVFNDSVYVGSEGFADVSGIINNNVITASTSGTGIRGSTDSIASNLETPKLLLTVTANTVSNTTGNGILLTARDATGLAEFGVRNNTVSAPLTVGLPGIRVDAGNAGSADDLVCLDISGNTSAGNATSGIGLRKQGAISTTNDFSVEGMAATATPGVETYVDAVNPLGNGTVLISATSGFSNCSTLAMEWNNQHNVLAQQSQPETILVAQNHQANFINARTNTLSRETAEQTINDVAVLPANVGGGKPQFLITQPMPMQSGETVTVNIGTLPAGESVTITFIVTVNSDIAVTEISNQGAVSGSNFSNVVTDDPDAGGASDATVTPVDLPDAAVTSINRDDPSPTNASSVSWTVTFGKSVSGVTSSNFTLVNSGLGGTPAITSVTAVTGSPDTQWTVTASTGTGDGTLGLNMTDGSGLSHELTNLTFTGQVYTLDRTVPPVSLDSNPSDPDNSDSPIFTFSSTDGTATFECQIDSGGYSPCSSGDTFGPLGDGSHTFDVQAVDPAGNTSTTPASFKWTVDTGAPDTSIDSAPALVSNSVDASFTFSSPDADLSGFECKLDGGSFAPCVSPKNYTGLTAGLHIFEARAVDTALNVDPTPASYSWLIDIGFPTVLLNAITVPVNNSTLTLGPTQIKVAFSENVTTASAEDIANYRLIEDGLNDLFDTTAADPCFSGIQSDDDTIAINSVSYNNNGGSGPFVATLSINGGTPLPIGVYRLYICGTTSIRDLAGNELNDGLRDTELNFSVIPAPIAAGSTQLPQTGFPQNRITQLPMQSGELAYVATDFWLEIPKLGVKMSIVGVPKTQSGWDVTWLNKDAGWLNGSAFPTWSGNSVLTGHVWDALNQPGPFAHLKNLKYGDQVKLHAFGKIYIYEVRASQSVSPLSVTTVFKHEEKSWVTLLTCEDYKERAQTYSYRRMVRAVLVNVIDE